MGRFIFHLSELEEREKLIYNDGNLIRERLSWKVHKGSILDVVNILYLDLGGSYAF